MHGLAISGLCVEISTEDFLELRHEIATAVPLSTIVCMTDLAGMDVVSGEYLGQPRRCQWLLGPGTVLLHVGPGAKILTNNEVPFALRCVNADRLQQFGLGQWLRRLREYVLERLAQDHRPWPTAGVRNHKQGFGNVLLPSRKRLR